MDSIINKAWVGAIVFGVILAAAGGYMILEGRAAHNEVRDTLAEDGERQGEKWLLRERRFGRFERSLTLPTQVKADEATADFEDGVLTITLPKAEAARPRSIQVRGAQRESQPHAIDVESQPAQ